RGRHHGRLSLFSGGATAVSGVEGAEELVLQRKQVAERIVATNDGHCPRLLSGNRKILRVPRFAPRPVGERNVKQGSVASSAAETSGRGERDRSLTSCASAL